MANYYDNYSDASRAVHALQNGNKEDGLQQLHAIRKRIVMQGEIKSLTWLLPEIDVLLARFGPLKLEEAVLAHPAGGR